MSLMDRPIDEAVRTPRQILRDSLGFQQGTAPPSRTMHSDGKTERATRQQFSSSAAGERSVRRYTGHSTSPVLEHTKQNLKDAQAQRTANRITELNSPENGGHLGIPGTAARQNVTLRRSKGRSSEFPDFGSRSPDAILKRRSNARPKDKRYSMESEVDFRSATAKIYQRRHREEFEGTYQTIPYSQYDPDHGLRHADGRPARSSSGPTLSLGRRERSDDEGKFMSPAEGDFLQNPVTPPDKKGRGEEIGNKDTRPYVDDSAFEIFLRRNIPSEAEDPELHEALTKLWQLRQEASHQLVKALSEDESGIFDEMEERVRDLNIKMHLLFNASQSKGELEFIDVDDLPLSTSPQISGDVADGNESSRFTPPQHFHNVVESIPRSSGSVPLPKRSFKTTGEDGFEISLVYTNHVTYKFVDNKTPTMFLFRMALNFLSEIFSRQADGHPDHLSYIDFPRMDNLEDVLLIANHRVVPIEGCLDELPIVEGDEVKIYYQPRNQRMTKLEQREEDDHADPLGVNGGTSFPSGNHAGYPRVESHPLNSARAPCQPGNNGRTFPSMGDKEFNQREGLRLRYDARTPGAGIAPQAHQDDSFPPALPRHSNDRSYDKIRQSFKCPRFTGQARDWKQWNKGFTRYLSIWDLDHVLDPDFIDEVPLPPAKTRDNKMVYYIIEDAVQNSPLAASYVRQAPLNNGFEAYYTLHDGYVFAGSTTATLLLNELSNFRLLPDETPTELCLRLAELFEELELLPGNAAITFIDTQRIGYLLNALRHESEWDVVCSAITSAQIKGNITFRDACEELKIRCETTRAHELMDKPIKGRKVKGLSAQAQSVNDTPTTANTEQVSALISTKAQRQNREKKKYVKQECLAAGCDEQTTFPLCGVHYHSLVSAKTPVLQLRNGYGEATYDATTSLILYPARVPADRLPSNSPKKVKAGLAQ